MAETATPHDAVFKTFLSRIETARDFIEIHLPPALTAICKLDTLRLESGSFLEDDLRPYYSDILYSREKTFKYRIMRSRRFRHCRSSMNHVSGGILTRWVQRR